MDTNRNSGSCKRAILFALTAALLCGIMIYILLKLQCGPSCPNIMKPPVSLAPTPGGDKSDSSRPDSVEKKAVVVAPHSAGTSKSGTIRQKNKGEKKHPGDFEDEPVGTTISW